MAEIRCPLCDRGNPIDSEFCQFCGARLRAPSPLEGKDTVIRPGEEPVRKPTSEFERVSPSLRTSRPLQPGEEPTKKDTAELEQALPAWLRAARQAGRETPPAQPTEPPAAGSASAEKAEELPPWLAEVEKEKAAEESELPDWLAGLQAQQEQEEEIPDWLASLRGISVAGESTAQPSPPKGSETPPFPLEETPPSAEVPSAGPAEPLAALTGEESPPLAAETPDWLASLTSEEAGTPPALTGEEAPPLAAETPDWLASLASEEAGTPPALTGEETPPPATEAPDWLASLASEEAGAPPALTGEEAPPLAAETPDWLASLASEEAGAPPAPTGEEAPPLSAETPDWLASLASEEAGAPPAPTGEEAPPLAAETPDWLASLTSEEAGAPPAPTGEEAPPLAAETPDWLASLTSEEAGAPPAPTSEEAPPLAAETPDWLASLTSEEAGAPPAPTSEEAPPLAAETPDWLKVTPPEGRGEPLPPFAVEEAAVPEAIPDWLKPAAEEKAPLAGEGIMPESAPAWLAGAEEEGKKGEQTSVPPLIGEAGEIESAAAFSIEAPDWLSTLQPEEVTAETAGAAAEEIAPAELPAWVQAMRPLEAAVEEAAAAVMEETPEETRGLLAGLRGVLPPASDIAPTRKPTAPPVKLQVSESHQALAAQLEAMVTEEGASRPGQKAAGDALPRFWRWLVAAILLFVAALPLISGGSVVPALTPPGQYDLMQRLAQIPANNPVAIVFDYEPALAGELEAAAAPLIDHLILISAARLTLLSTSPNGPALAEHFMQSVEGHHHYQPGQQYVNLGYLPGGAAAMLTFASNPRAAGPADLWQSSLLADVHSLRDYAALIVLTDSPDVGRLWIEQARPYLGDRPLILVASAQAEPLLQPYYDSGQIQGLVIGLAGGKAYEQALPAPGAALGARYWGAFGAVLLTAALLMIVGSVWGASLAWRERLLYPNRKKGDRDVKP